MGWCWRRCLSEEVVDGEDDIGHYPLCWGFFVFLGGLFFPRRSRDDDGDDDEWETYMTTRNGIFSFFQLYISCAANRFFFCLSHPRSYTCKDSYVGFVVVAVGRGPCRGLGSSVLNRCLVVRKGIAEMVADASTHAMMYHVKVLGGILL